MKRRNLFTGIAGLFGALVGTAQPQTVTGLALQPQGNVHVGTGDGVRKAWTLDYKPFSTSLMVFRNGVLMSQPEDYTQQQTGRAGLICQIAFVAPPGVGDSIRAYYLR